MEFRGLNLRRLFRSVKTENAMRGIFFRLPQEVNDFGHQVSQVGNKDTFYVRCGKTVILFFSVKRCFLLDIAQYTDVNVQLCYRILAN